MEEIRERTALDVYQQHLQEIYRIAYTYLRSRSQAEKAAEETFRKMVRSRVRLDDEFRLKGWLINTVTQYCLLQTNTAGFTFAGDEDEQTDEVLRSIMELPGKYKTIVYLFYYDGYTAQEISDMLGENNEIINTIVSKSRLSLRRKLGGDFDD